MSRRETIASDAQEKLDQHVLEKYRELYTYSTDILLKEHERFNRADEKAAKYSTTFIFLLGIVAYFDKWFFDRFQWPDSLVKLSSNWLLFVADAVGLLALILSIIGFFLTIHAIKLRPVVSRPLDQSVLDFFENQPLLNIYYGLARENSNAYEINKKATDEKYTTLTRSYFLMKLVFALLVALTLIYCLHSRH
jgi:hypothetical protein